MELINRTLNQIILIKALKLFTFLYILFLPFRFGPFSYSDIIFPFLFFILFKYKFIYFNRKLIYQFLINNKLLIITLLIFVASYLISAVNNIETPYNIKNWILFVGVLYLLCVAYTFAILPHYIDLSDISKYAFYSALIHSFIGIIAYLLFYIGLETNLVCLECTQSPYYSNIPRLVSFTESPNAIAFYLLACIFISAMSSSINKTSYLFYYSIILLCVFFTYSKTLYVFICLSFLFFFVKGHFFKITGIIIIGAVYFLGTHFYIDINGACDAQRAIYSIEYGGFIFDLCKTYFYDQKKVYIDILYGHFDFFGLGVSVVHKFGAPHSLLFESLILYGVLGLLSFFLFILYLASTINVVFLDKFFYIYFIFFIFILSMNEDLFRYRELWVFLGLLTCFLALEKNRNHCVE